MATCYLFQAVGLLLARCLARCSVDWSHCGLLTVRARAATTSVHGEVRKRVRHAVLTPWDWLEHVTARELRQHAACARVGDQEVHRLLLATQEEAATDDL